MHRSNTSALAGALAAMGLGLPEASDLVVGMPDNPNHYESSSLIAFNDELLERLGGRWDIPPELHAGWETAPAIQEREGAGRAAVTRTFPEFGPKVWKDPRLCLLLPFWRQELAGPLAVVFIWRSPAEVADSLRRRGGSTLLHGLALWERYNRAALSAMQGLPAYVIDSDALVDAPRESCANLASWLDAIGLSAGTRGWDVDAATAIIEPALTHHPDFGGDSPPSQVAFIEHLRSLSGAHANFDQRDPGPDSPWSSETLALLRKLDLTTDQLAQLGLGNKQLSDEHQDLIATYEDLVAVAGDRLSVIRRLQDIVAATQDDVAELTGRLDRVAAEAADWQRRAERAAVELTEIRTSNSWKATAPLRAAREAVDSLTRRRR
jgi:hypothetical protein